MSSTIQIQESCGCGATLIYSSSRNISGLDVSEAQAAFHKAHAACKPKPPIKKG